MTAALEGGEWSAARLGRTLPRGKTRFPLYRRLGGPQGRSGQARKISPPPEFDPLTVQPAVSRYSDGATRPTSGVVNLLKLLLFSFNNKVSQLTSCIFQTTVQLGEKRFVAME
jgi:hypothetical protein